MFAFAYMKMFTQGLLALKNNDKIEIEMKTTKTQFHFSLFNCLFTE